MPKATDTHTTHALGPNRRALMGGATALAASATVALANNTAEHSPEFVAYRKRHAEWLAVHEGDHVEDKAFYALEEMRSEALRSAIHRVIEREPQSRQDVIERALIVYDQLWDEVGKHSYREDIEHALLQAIFAMAEGGALNS